MNPKNTPFEIKRLLGRRFKDPQLQKDLMRLPFKVRARCCGRRGAAGVLSSGWRAAGGV